MKRALAVVSMLVWSGACLTAQAAGMEVNSGSTGFNCASPTLPARSMTKESVQRVVNGVKLWVNCYDAYSKAPNSAQDMAQADALNQQVALKVDAWAKETRFAQGNSIVVARSYPSTLRYQQGYMHRSGTGRIGYE